jgi:CRP-like cAMP-binding protein
MNTVSQLRAGAGPCALHVRGSNRLLTLVQHAGEDGIMRHMEKMALKQRDVLFHANVPITHVYFPLSGMGSLVVNLEEGPTIEVGTVGNEGMVGVPLLLGADRSPTEAFVQISGEFLRMPADAFTAELGRNGAFAHAARRFAQAFFAQVAQSTACGQFHPVEQRLSRWILMPHDRAGLDTLQLTQEFLAMMLGVQRPSVTLAATTLQEAGLIKYRRGIIDVLDREGLEATSCKRYAVVRKEFERLLC